MAGSLAGLPFAALESKYDAVERSIFGRAESWISSLGEKP